MLKVAGGDHVFIDHLVSGAAAEGLDLNRLPDQLRDGDVVVVTKLDRLGRFLPQVFDIIETIEHRGAGLRSIAESEIDTNSAAGKLVFRLFAGASGVRAGPNSRADTGRNRQGESGR